MNASMRVKNGVLIMRFENGWSIDNNRPSGAYVVWAVGGQVMGNFGSNLQAAIEYIQAEA